MNESEIQTIVQEVMRRLLSEQGRGASTGTSSCACQNGHGHASGAGDSESVAVTSVVTRNEISEFVKAGKKRLLVQRGGLITPLARDLATEHGLEIVWASEEAGGNGASARPSSNAEPGASAGETALACLRCHSCLEPAFYERALRELEGSTARVLGELRAFIQRCWEQEPPDIRRLRTISRPPMGTLPCCFYANFNLFWAGENLQVCRLLVQSGTLPVAAVSQMVAALLERHAARLEKWEMSETVALERMLIQYFRGAGPASAEEFLAVVEHAMIALDRVQSWIDGLLPWSDLDARVALRHPIWYVRV